MDGCLASRCWQCLDGEAAQACEKRPRSPTRPTPPHRPLTICRPGRLRSSDKGHEHSDEPADRDFGSSDVRGDPENETTSAAAQRGQGLFVGAQKSPRRFREQRTDRPYRQHRHCSNRIEDEAPVGQAASDPADTLHRHKTKQWCKGEDAEQPARRACGSRRPARIDQAPGIGHHSRERGAHGRGE